MKLLDIYVAEKTDVRLSIHSPGRIAENVADHLRPVFEKKKSTLKGKYEKGKCLLEPDLFRSLLLNLVDNSRKALEKGGRIALTCTMTETGCRLTVEDNGRGMPPEVLAHLTEAFYRVDKSRARAQGGAGLGLALCERIAVLHGGAIHFASTPGQGTTVTVSLEGGRP